jgi:hypothetical protein
MMICQAFVGCVNPHGRISFFERATNCFRMESRLLGGLGRVKMQPVEVSPLPDGAPALAG